MHINRTYESKKRKHTGDFTFRLEQFAFKARYDFLRRKTIVRRCEVFPVYLLNDDDDHYGSHSGCFTPSR